MCGRFALAVKPETLTSYFNLTGALELAPSWNIAPSLNIATITGESLGSRQINIRRWGLIPSWAKDAAVGSKLNNARGETVAEKPSFRSALKYRRCLIPATGFYEWHTENGIKQPWFISLKSGETMAFAGLWETWQPAGGEAVESCCIITTSANAIMEPIHERMPVILQPGQWEVWLSQQEHKSDHLLPLLCPHDADSMQAWPVSRELNRIGLRNDEGLLEPVTITPTVTPARQSSLFL
jgi:putative SOS response-associated peptidase YedK